MRKAFEQEALRIVNVIADKIEDDSLFHAGIFSRAELAKKVRTVVNRVQELEALHQPLTDEQIQTIGLDMPSMPHPGSLLLFARAVERAHGIQEA